VLFLRKILKLFNQLDISIMEYRSMADLTKIIKQNLYKVPTGIDLVVGVPRSGLLVANLIALHLNLPLVDLEGFCEQRIFCGGERLIAGKSFSEVKNILVVEDSVLTGKSIKQAKSRIDGLFPEKRITYLAAFIVPDAISMVDLFFDVCPFPRVFEWNIMHHSFLAHCCVDIDGVLCYDPEEAENDDGENYLSFLKNPKLLARPTKIIGCLVTNRLEKYRSLTEDWLAMNNIIYDRLVMMDLPTGQARQRLNAYAEFKALAYLRYNAELFIESSLWQAKMISELSGKPVYCVESNQMIVA